MFSSGFGVSEAHFLIKIFLINKRVGVVISSMAFTGIAFQDEVNDNPYTFI